MENDRTKDRRIVLVMIIEVTRYPGTLACELGELPSEMAETDADSPRELVGGFRTWSIRSDEESVDEVGCRPSAATH